MAVSPSTAGGEDWRANLSGGQTFNGGKTNFVAMIDTYHRKLLGTSDRKFTRAADVRRVRNGLEPWNANADGTARVTGAPSDVLIAGGPGVRPREFKAKDINVLSQSLRAVGGVRGKGISDFEWESAAMYSRAWTRDAENFNIRHRLLQAALLRADNTAFNPFGYTFRNVGAPSRSTSRTPTPLRLSTR